MKSVITIRRPSVRTAAAAMALSLAAWGATAQAGTAAYWRHEQGPVGSTVPGGPNTVLDDSGNSNHMQTFDPTFTAASYTSAVSPLPLRSGLPNNLALNFGPGGDDSGLNDDNYTAGTPIQTQLFNGLTVELAFNMNVINGYQAIFGKDGQPLSGSPVPPFKVLIRGDSFPDEIPNQLFIEFIDGNGVAHFVSSRQTVVAGQWNHIAFTLNATTAELWVAGASTSYTKLDSITGTFAGASGEVLISDGGSYTIGRGMFNGGVTDWADAIIDEVRLSDQALTPSQFLFDAIAAGIPGDYNNNGTVDAADYTVWADNFGRTGANIPGDGNGSGTVDAADYTVWADNFGRTTPPGAAVPEPAALALALPALAVLRRRR